MELKGENNYMMTVVEFIIVELPDNTIHKLVICLCEEICGGFLSVQQTKTCKLNLLF